MHTHDDLPGTPQHQALLRAVVRHYEHDERILAVCVFGSLARGNWDHHSDLDLDIVVTDVARLDVLTEVRRLCATFERVGETLALLIPDGAEEAHVVLASGMGLSVRYHPLHTTSPNIVDSLHVLSGRIAVEEIIRAGRRQPRTAPPSLGYSLDGCVRYIVEADAAIDRGRLWMALELLHRARHMLLELYARTHGAQRAVQAFDACTDDELLQRMCATVPHASLSDLRGALLALLDLLETELPRLTAYQLGLPTAHRDLLHNVRRDLER